MSEFNDDDAIPGILPQDPYLPLARQKLEAFFSDHRDEIFFSRQLEVRFEADFFHWITNRALRDLAEAGVVKTERRELASHGAIHLYWDRRNRYVSRAADRVVALVSDYATYSTGEALGRHGEWMVMEGFVRNQFVQRGRETREYGGQRWTQTGHNIDFIFERDGVAYGLEVKNTLGYMEHEELQTKVALCVHLGLRPVMVCRMLPWAWVHEDVNSVGGFGLLLKYQLYHWTHADLARRVREELGLSVDAPERLHDVTMRRFLNWHVQNV